MLTDRYFDRHVTYVAATRHRNHLEIHYDLETFTSQEHFYETLSRENRQDLVLDYVEASQLNTSLLSVEVQTLLAEYLDVWIQRDDCVRQKHRYWVSDRERAKAFEAQSLSFDETLQHLSISILEESLVVTCLSQSVTPSSVVSSASLTLEDWQAKLKAQVLSQAEIHQVLAMIQHQSQGYGKQQEQGKGKERF